ncbi:MAG TPA: hypothetical protein VI112_04360 [Bacteroidia bacterium]|jgi:hypothetical protein
MKANLQKFLLLMSCLAIAGECVSGYFVYQGGHAFNSSLGMCGMRWNELEPAYHLYLFGMALACTLFVSLPFIYSAQAHHAGNSRLVDEHFTKLKTDDNSKNVFVKVSGLLSLLAGLLLLYLISRSLFFLFLKPHRDRFLLQALMLAGVLTQVLYISRELFSPERKEL